MTCFLLFVQYEAPIVRRYVALNLHSQTDWKVIRAAHVAISERSITVEEDSGARRN